MGMADREKLEKLISEIQYMGGLESRLAEHLLANGVTFSVAVPGHENNYDIAEMAYNNGYAKGFEDGSNRKHGRWIKRNHGQVGWVECSECFVCGSPEWVSCPVCDTKMEASNG